MTITAACHVHSDWSYDGSWTLEELASEFGRRGCRVLMMTEHDRGFTPSRLREYREACRTASSRNVLVVPGIEYSEATNTVHVLTWGDIPFLGENRPTRDMLVNVRKAGGIAVLAHPSRRNAWRSFDPSWAQYLLGIEVWNRKTDGWRPSGPASRLIASAGAVPFAGMDFHDRKQLFPLTMSLELDGTPSENSVLDCFKARRCRACAFGVVLNTATVKTIGAAVGPLEFARRCCRWIYRSIAVARTPQVPRRPHS